MHRTFLSKFSQEFREEEIDETDDNWARLLADKRLQAFGDDKSCWMTDDKIIHGQESKRLFQEFTLAPSYFVRYESCETIIINYFVRCRVKVCNWNMFHHNSSLRGDFTSTCRVVMTIEFGSSPLQILNRAQGIRGVLLQVSFLSKLPSSKAVGAGEGQIRGKAVERQGFEKCGNPLATVRRKENDRA